ncbi:MULTISPECIES: DnaJ domain-containing protein [Methylobacterium]|uniref:Chaperone protein DnaJ n=1 Tax=Methylobacterium jeotgali TaxID=381630 RepID=A0ABQ4STE2_9HYPH|nr:MULTISPECIES: DnaJ domain-containing protein [Methylobacterium]PIU08308.1 MAG: molecular chaperone DnaJ [Methylobacterium sp. CG09_land_8_20_14_0_10_71_15]PIU11592.1 MAG: molecular chaperone DnaJ [Methylobacterium sp. CG08_land_8_20_14_0_20_71_15]GBU19532.1 molecular chaperone DnaJ [Methylobacterium sp.]GJE05049.1 Chaperone protein DnaJ [Methylobacterium jeotgali]
MDLNSPLFDKIRIKRTCDEPKAAAKEGVCETPGCTNPGLYRAPKGRKAEGQYWRFCMDHVRAYNATYNYFDGMNDAAVQAYQKDALIGHRPTWAMGMNADAPGRAGEAKAKPQRDWAYVDPLGILRAEGVGAAEPGRAAEPRRPRYSAQIRKALDVMGLDDTADSAAIKAQYKTLVKRFHPDANGGDRGFEERLRDIIRAHDVLRAAGLC